MYFIFIFIFCSWSYCRLIQCNVLCFHICFCLWSCCRLCNIFFFNVIFLFFFSVIFSLPPKPPSLSAYVHTQTSFFFFPRVSEGDLIQTCTWRRRRGAFYVTYTPLKWNLRIPQTKPTYSANETYLFRKWDLHSQTCTWRRRRGAFYVTYVHMEAQGCICMDTRTRARAHTHTHTHTHMLMQVECMCMETHTHTHAHTHTHTRTHTHTHADAGWMYRQTIAYPCMSLICPYYVPNMSLYVPNIGWTYRQTIAFPCTGLLRGFVPQLVPAWPQ